MNWSIDDLKIKTINKIHHKPLKSLTMQKGCKSKNVDNQNNKKSFLHIYSPYSLYMYDSINHDTYTIIIH